MSTHKIAVISSAVALSVAAAAAHTADNPFELKTLGQGYQVADAEKAKDGKCGNGNCGADKKKAREGHHHDKAKENADAANKMKEGDCSADKMKDGGCHASK
ncbi:hypothetical protein SAMN05192566_2530 [Methylophilus rhizosphaerae]|uniref:Low-complexity protein n=1 Tax=Methylophilus rhizosphaerae TaxID=492660 RepID=A0A1G9EYL8_9PROT|nr:hypothetical protein [Methylophilus rhizosphaerae]SDK81249.1 hypothetical protein SAMN05192566_2530 [Methylophilus rhizosphaerae]